jgi:Flp pilus assembly protein TadD
MHQTPPPDADRTMTATADQQKHTATLSLAPPFPAGYENLGEIGRGGMGVVYRARDLALDREIAVKVLLDDFPAESLAAHRFLEEARITAQLQHPGIPAVHQVGMLGRGRPYLAMKLIRGLTLDVMLKKGGVNPLSVFEAIAQAVAYAHSRGVIHRDLKPQNVMVGAFGEVQIMDWGLAKVLHAPSGSKPVIDVPVTAEHRILNVRSSDSQTQQGEFMGTPAYMAPEQAVGATDKIDERSDVFGLGGILCAMLTGRPPFSGGDAESTRLLAAQGKVEDAYARLDACKAEPDVVALAKRCLAVTKADRPADAGEVARAIAELRTAAEERARKAEMEQVAAAARRRVLSRASVVVFAALAVGGCAAVLQAIRATNAERETAHQLVLTKDAEAAARAGEEKARHAAAEAKTSAAKAREAEEVAKKSEAEAVRLAAVAKKSEAEAKDAEQKARAAEADAKSSAETARLAQEESKAAELKAKAAEADATASAATARARELAEKAAKEEAIRQERTATAVLFFLQDLLAPASADGVLGRDKLPDPKITLKESLDRAANDIEVLLTGQPLVEAAIRNTIGQAYMELGAVSEARQNYDRALALFERHGAADHPVALSVLHNLGFHYRAVRGGEAESEAYYRRALAGREKRMGPDHPDTLRTASSLASMYDTQGRYELAEPLYRRALDGREKTAGADHADTLKLANNLGYLYLLMGRPDRAEPLLVRALRGKERSLPPDHPSLLSSANNVAAAYAALGKHEEAEARFQWVLEKREKVLGPAHPHTLLTVHGLAAAYRDRGKHADAEELFRRAVRDREALHGAAHEETLESVVGLAKLYDAAARPKDAEPLWRKAVAGYAQLRPASWEGPDARSRLGATLVALKRPADAEAELTAAFEELSGREATLPRHLRDATLRAAAARAIDGFTALKKDADVTAWRAKLAAIHDLAPPPREAK